MSDACKNCSDANCSAKQKRPGENDQEYNERKMRTERMCKVKNKILVLSGKGGVGKSTVAVNMAMGLAAKGAKVGLIDADIHGPSVPKMLKLENSVVMGDGQNGIYPVEYSPNLKVISVGFFIESQDSPIIWRGPRKFGLIKQFLENVEWGELDYLIFDLPPGTGDEALSICQLIDDVDGAVIVTTPQGVAITDVRKSISFCRQLKLEILGVIENMSGFVCPKCGEIVHIFGKGGAEKMGWDMNVELLGNLPIEPEIVAKSDEGIPYLQSGADSATANEMNNILDKVAAKLKH